MKKDSVIVFFHGYGSSVNTDKFVKIPYTNKKAIQLDYDKGLKETLEKAENFVKEQLKEYEEVILVGHSMGGYLANQLSAKLNQPAVLINPSIFPHDNKHEICDIDTMFQVSNSKVNILVENDDELFNIPKQKELLLKLPNNYHIEFFNNGHHRINRISDIAYSIADVSKFNYPEFI